MPDAPAPTLHPLELLLIQRLSAGAARLTAYTPCDQRDDLRSLGSLAQEYFGSAGPIASVGGLKLVDGGAA